MEKVERRRGSRVGEGREGNRIQLEKVEGPGCGKDFKRYTYIYNEYFFGACSIFHFCTKQFFTTVRSSIYQ